MKIFAIIHNNSLIIVRKVADFNEATKIAQKAFEEHCGRQMNQEEELDWKSNHEVINLEDPCEQWTFSLCNFEIDP